jgi:hypothetical protein
MVLIEQKKFTKEESLLFYNLENRVFMDDNGNIVINNDSQYEILRYENTLTNVPITNIIYDGLIQGINNPTDTTKTLGSINNYPEDDNPCISKNGKWILHRSRNLNKNSSYTPIYYLSYSSDELPVIIKGHNYFLIFILFCGAFIFIFIAIEIIKLIKNSYLKK